MLNDKLNMVLFVDRSLRREYLWNAENTCLSDRDLCCAYYLNYTSEDCVVCSNV